jgi:mannose-6-phosphate isomerase class I
MSIALTPFEAMCGFRTIPEIRRHLSLYPELASILGTNGTPHLSLSCPS